MNAIRNVCYATLDRYLVSLPTYYALIKEQRIDKVLLKGINEGVHLSLGLFLYSNHEPDQWKWIKGDIFNLGMSLTGNSGYQYF